MRQHVGFTASLATKYSDVKLGENSALTMPELEEWSVEKHTEESSTDAYGVINFQGGSHSYRAKVGSEFLSAKWLPLRTLGGSSNCFCVAHHVLAVHGVFINFHR